MRHASAERVCSSSGFSLRKLASDQPSPQYYCPISLDEGNPICNHMVTYESRFDGLSVSCVIQPGAAQVAGLDPSSTGQSVNELCAHFEVSRIAIMKHLGVLEASQLIVLQRKGRRREIYFNVIPIQMIYDRWTSEYSQFWAAKAIDLKHRIESSLESPSHPVPSSKRKKTRG